jgi:hypothetical protein
VITNVYATCTPEGKAEFLNCLHDVVMPDDTDWLLMGDFNLIKRPSDQNRPGGMFKKSSDLMKSLVILA